MRSLYKKLLSASLAATMSLSLCSAMPVVHTSALELGTYEAEDLEPTNVWTDIYGQEFPGYSGTGFVYHQNTTITMEIEAPEAGMYEISCRYVQINESVKKSTVSVNGMDYLKSFPYTEEWTDVSLGNYRLEEGTNTIEFKPIYGYLAYDTITIVKADLPELVGNSVPCDSEATPETKALMQYLSSVYGDHIISGQQEIYGGGHDDHEDGYDMEFEYIYDLTGEYPAIRGFDLMNYNPLYGWDDGSTDRMIDWVNNRGGIATVCWHINIPQDFANYTVGEAVDWTAATYKPNDSFNVANVVVEGTKEYEYMQLAIEDLAEQLLIAQEAGVPILFRPFHEAEGNGGLDGAGAWFWWSQDGVEPYRAMWEFLYEELTEKYGLHNLIWVQNLYAWSAESAQWYAGDDYVDIVGLDKYNCVYNRHDGNTSGPNLDAESGIFYGLYDHVDGKKMVAMPENDTVPSLENLTIEKAGWLYFCVWYDNGQENFLSGADKQDPAELTKLYQSDYCITLDELPADLYSYTGEDTTEGTTEDTSEEETTEGTTSSEADVVYGDANLDGEPSVADVILVNQYYMQTADLDEQGIINADVNKDGAADLNDSLAILKSLIGLVTLPITE